MTQPLVLSRPRRTLSLGSRSRPVVRVASGRPTVSLRRRTSGPGLRLARVEATVRTSSRRPIVRTTSRDTTLRIQWAGPRGEDGVGEGGGARYALPRLYPVAHDGTATTIRIHVASGDLDLPVPSVVGGRAIIDGGLAYTITASGPWTPLALNAGDLVFLYLESGRLAVGTNTAGPNGAPVMGATATGFVLVREGVRTVGLIARSVDPDSGFVNAITSTGAVVPTDPNSLTNITILLTDTAELVTTTSHVVSSPIQAPDGLYRSDGAQFDPTADVMAMVTSDQISGGIRCSYAVGGSGFKSCNLVALSVADAPAIEVVTSYGSTIIDVSTLDAGETILVADGNLYVTTGTGIDAGVEAPEGVYISDGSHGTGPVIAAAKGGLVTIASSIAALAGLVEALSDLIDQLEPHVRPINADDALAPADQNGYVSIDANANDVTLDANDPTVVPEGASVTVMRTDPSAFDVVIVGNFNGNPNGIVLDAVTPSTGDPIDPSDNPGISVRFARVQNSWRTF